MEQRDFVRDISRLLHDLTGILKLLNRDEKLCYGLTWPQAFTVEALAGGALTMGELGTRMGVAESTATRILNVLVRDGLVERKPGESDRRQVRASLTAKGRTMAQKLVACRERGIAELIAPLSSAQRKNLVAAMETVKSAMAGGKSCC